MTTLVEFLQPVRTASNRDRCLAVLLFAKHFEAQDGLRASDVGQKLVSARVPQARKVNASDVLSKAGHYVDGQQIDGGTRKLWSLTDAGETYIAAKLGFVGLTNPVANEVSVLTALVAGIGDEVVRSYVGESLTCLSAGAVRAAVVFLWTGAVRTLQERVFTTYGGPAVTSALQVHDPRTRNIRSIDGFSSVNDATFLLGCRELGMIDKGQWTTLVEALNLRNRCGHPTRYKPGAKKAASFVEDVVGICF